MFEDCHNYIDLNPQPEKEYVPENYRSYLPEMSKTLEPEIRYARTQEDVAPVYQRHNQRSTHKIEVQQKVRIPQNYETQPKYERKYESNPGYRKVYVGTESDQEDDKMQEESDNSDEHHSPHMYVTKSQQSNFSKQHKLRNNAQNAQLELLHSSSSSRLKYTKEVKPTRTDYSRDKTRSSTSNLGVSRFERTKPVPRAELHIDSLTKEPLNNTTHEFDATGFSNAKNNITTSLSYKESDPERRYEPSYNDQEASSALSDRYRKLVSTSTYGKALVSSYNSYFKHEREHIRPTNATLGKKYNYRQLQ